MSDPSTKCEGAQGPPCLFCSVFRLSLGACSVVVTSESPSLVFWPACSVFFVFLGKLRLQPWCNFSLTNLMFSDRSFPDGPT